MTSVVSKIVLLQDQYSPTEVTRLAIHVLFQESRFSSSHVRFQLSKIFYCPFFVSTPSDLLFRIASISFNIAGGWGGKSGSFTLALHLLF